MSDLKTVREVMQPWKNAQYPMGAVPRWGNFPDYEQTLLMHNNSVPWVADWVMSKVSQNHAIDQTLLFRAFMVHDHGEPLTGGDEHIDARTEGKEVREWIAFSELIKTLPSPYTEQLRKAFLLQYVRRESVFDDLPEQAQLIVHELRNDHKTEAIVFEFSERIDYLFTALDGFDRDVKNDKEGMLEHCFRNQASKLDALCKELPVLQNVWSPQLNDEIAGFAVEEWGL